MYLALGGRSTVTLGTRCLLVGVASIATSRQDDVDEIQCGTFTQRNRVVSGKHSRSPHKKKKKKKKKNEWRPDAAPLLRTA
ncbi:hypothetical protein P170DRAFT_219725 [Aspergillus steynii IBT 23096]|uniref:Uncharacterized protein n=1 Tax=Aspergillus steynii IBT 23096 TaxID=1392250 RepID=A0A2I2G1F8_9EURO|nr:uncharacterized protein P170DRAFT_219725 [Aspergillus steynii IBT 23096]PLB46708.1 hypothetical protein P170DRAFT_219725 [Aspergillus steynii IBT 23096]